MRSENPIYAPSSLAAVSQNDLWNSSIVCLTGDDPFTLSPFAYSILKWADIEMAVS